MQEKLFQRCVQLLYFSVLSLGGNVNTPRSVEAWHGIHLSHKKSMKYSGHRKLLCELSKPSKFNAFNLLGYWTNTDASILVYKFRPERPGFNMYGEYTLNQMFFAFINLNVLSCLLFLNISKLLNGHILARICMPKRCFFSDPNSRICELSVWFWF